ncbi:MAG: porin family protein [Algoriphagus sp.]|nr:porin family protein [Algoriphagus sp.]
MMKKLLFSLALVICVNLTSQAQEIRLNTYAGYVFADKVDSYYSSSSYYEGKIQENLRWGLGIEYKLDANKAFELQYLRQDTQVPLTYLDSDFGGNVKSTEFDLAMNWIMLNGTNYIKVNETVEPFIGGGIGMAIFNVENPDTGYSDGGTKFAWAIRGGSNFWVSEKVAIRIQANLMSAVQSVGGGIYFGTGGGGAGVSTYSTMYQFGFEGGLVFLIPR